MTQPERQKYRCSDCGRWFDDLTGTVFAGRHQPLRTWVLCLSFMGLNLSNHQISKELDLNKDDVQDMTRQLREHLKGAQPEPLLTGEVEADEVDVVASHTGQPDAVKAQGRSARRRRLKGARGRGTLAKEKPPILGLIQRGGELVIRMLENVQQVTIKPVIRTCVAEGTRFDTDEYDIDARLSAWGYDHQSVWSLLRSWLRPHRGLSQEHLPLYLSVFQFVHNARVRDKRLLGALLGALLAGPVWNP